MSAVQDARRLVIVSAAERLAAEAVSAARDEPGSSAAWRFYRGVEAAALHVVRPEVASVRDGTAWLQAEAPSFRDGFLRASTLLAAAATAPNPPLRVALPYPLNER